MGVRSDLRLAARQLRRAPLVSLAAVLTLALAIGANTAVFSAVRTLLLVSLPFAQADELHVIWARLPGAPFPRLPLSYPDFDRLRTQLRGTAEVAAWTSLDSTRVAIERDPPLEVRYGVATTNLLAVLGVAPVRGHGFARSEEKAAANREILLGHELWERLGGDPRLVGGTLRLDGASYRVAGVLPRAFRFGGNAEV